MRKIRKIQAKRKACFTNKKGKKQCYVLSVPKKYKVNPGDELEKDSILEWAFDIIKTIEELLKVYGTNLTKEDLIQITHHLREARDIVSSKV